MTVAKGLTAGYLPMGALLMSEAVYETIAGASAEDVPIGHGQTYSAHPVSAAVALEVLRLYNEGGLQERHRAGAALRGGNAGSAPASAGGDARQRGLLGALELVSDKASRRGFEPSLRLSERIARAAYGNRLIFRAFGDNILGFAPALCCGPREYELLFERLGRTLDQVLAEPDVRAAVA